MKAVEIRYINRRFEELRLKDTQREKMLCLSIAEKGLREPVKVVEKSAETVILIDGYKRLRSLIKLGIHYVNVIAISTDEAEGLLQLMRFSNANKLSYLEEALVIDELNRHYGLAVRDIANHLERSKAWVSVRKGIIEEMGEKVKEALQTGRFPVRSYMYTLRQFTRVNEISKHAVECFVEAVSGKGYSTRDIDLLAYGYFRGGKELKDQIEHGNSDWTLKCMKRSRSESAGTAALQGLNETEGNIIRDLELAQKYINKTTVTLINDATRSRAFQANACIVIKGILDNIERFNSTLKDFYDRKRAS